MPAQLSLMTDVDAPLDAHLADLTPAAGAGLDEVFGRCDSYPDVSQRTPAARLAFLRRHSRSASAFYVNRPGRSVEQILQEEQLRRAIGGFLDSAGLPDQSPESARKAIRRFVEQRPDLQWALRPAAPPDLTWRIKELIHRIGHAILLLVLSPLLLLLS